MSIKRPVPVLWVSGAHGVRLPQEFAESFMERACVAGVDADAWSILEAGPTHEKYWNVWDEFLRNAIVTAKDGVKYRVHHDDDCWLIPQGMQRSKENWFYWEE